MRKVFTIILSFTIGIMWSQNGSGKSVPPQEANPPTFPKIIPPSPTASSLGNYGNVPVGLFTGSSNITIPLLNYKTNNLNIPINLFYSSNGLKVDEVSSNVGMGWILNYGGVITRTVRDEPDDLHDSDFLPQNVAGGMANTVALQFYQDAGNHDSYDSEMDIYSFNFNGVSGKFFYDKDHIPHLYKQDDIKIERIPMPSNTSSGFLITISNGEKYYFTKAEKTAYRSVGSGYTWARSSYTSWYLTKIVHPNGDEIYFDYDAANLLPYVSSESQTLRMTYPYMQFIGNGYLISEWPRITDKQENIMDVNGHRIVKISSNNPIYGNIDFTYYSNPNEVDVDGNFKIKSITHTDANRKIIESIKFNYLNTQNKRNFLTGIEFNDLEKAYTFDYNNPESFPKRLDKGQDYWGYYNGKINSTWVPKDFPNDFYGLSEYEYDGADKKPDPIFAEMGLLKKIIYPTKGFTEISYEGNEYYGSKVNPPANASYHLSIKNGMNNHNASDSKTIDVEYDQWIKITGRSFFDSEDPSCTDLLNNVTMLDVTDQNNQPVQLWVRSGLDNNYAQTNLFGADESVFYIYAKSGYTYTIKISTYRFCTSAVCDIYYKTGPATTFQGNLPTGGVRIKSTADYIYGSATPIYKRYRYNLGDKGADPIYTDNVIQSVSYDGINGTANFLIVSSNSSIAMSSSDSTCYYGQVSISNGGDNFENGGETKTYNISRDYPGIALWGENFHNAPWANFGWDNGNELGSAILEKNKSTGAINIIKETINTYSENDESRFEMNNYAFRLRYVVPRTQSVTKVCTQEDMDRVYTQKVCKAEHHHSWYLPTGRCIASGADNETIYSYDLCHYHYVGYPVSYPYILNNLDVMEYKNISYRQYLKSQITTDYLNGTPLQTTTEYFYNDPTYYQLTSQKTTLPDFSTQETHYKYAQNLVGTEAIATDMIQENMVGIPLETETVKNGLLISKSKTKYDKNEKTNNLILPISVLSKNLESGTMEQQIAYGKYDSKGNLQQYTTKSGITVAIIWGYNQTQPIAKIEGALYSDVSGSIGDIISYSNTDALVGSETSEQDLIAKLDAFRIALPNYQITTYTYDPLIGVRSITPPSGIREIYIYDASNRLKEVKDVNGNLLKEYQYHYKQP